MPSSVVTDRRLRLFGHIARSSPQEDHHRAVAAVIRGLPPDWKRPLGKPSHTWLRAVEADLDQQNIGLASACRKAAIRDDWRRIVDTATLQRSRLCYKRRRKKKTNEYKNEGHRERTEHLDIFLFPPITQWCSISDVLFTDGRGVSDFSVLKYY